MNRERPGLLIKRRWGRPVTEASGSTSNKQIVNRFRVQGYNGIKKRIHKTDGFCNARYLAERKEQEAERKEWEAEMKA